MCAQWVVLPDDKGDSCRQDREQNTIPSDLQGKQTALKAQESFFMNGIFFQIFRDLDKPQLLEFLRFMSLRPYPCSRTDSFRPQSISNREIFIEGDVLNLEKLSHGFSIFLRMERVVEYFQLVSARLEKKKAFRQLGNEFESDFDSVRTSFRILLLESHEISSF
jgi:hypothetical protein